MVFFVLLQCLLTFPQHFLLYWRPFGVFFGLFCGIFLYFLRTFSFLMKFCTYILDNTLIYSNGCQTKKLWGYYPLPGAFEIFFFWRGGTGYIFSIFLYSLRKFRYVFMNFCKDIFAITLTIAKINMACCLHFTRPF